MGALLVGAWALFMAFFVALTVAQLTAPGPGKALLSRALVAILDLDAALPHLEATLHEAAQEADTPSVVVPDFPIRVEVDRQEAAALAGEGLRSLLVAEASERVYRHGLGVLATEGEEVEVGTLSLPGALRQGLGLIGDESHWAATAVTVILGLAFLATIALPLLRLPPWGKMACLGAIWAATGLPLLALGLGGRFGLEALQRGGSPFVDQLLQVGVEAATVLMRSSLVLSALGTAFLALAVLFWLGGRPSPSLTRQGQDA
jgi:hypothetical protein